MCGLAGVLSGSRVPDELLRAMAGSLAHRGPDDEGIWSAPDAGIGFAHRRLSIVDLSPSGHQPMASSGGRYMLAFNGEIYNHLELRTALDAQRATSWRGTSDTETLIECIEAWGLAATLKKSVGMFALALWDRRDRQLLLARDRFGEKPLYYGWTGGDFVFGSELKALRRHPRFDNGVDRDALRLLAARAYIPAPFSIYGGIRKLEPGVILTVDEEAWRGPSAELRMEPYWSYREAVVKGLADPIHNEEEALHLLERALGEAISAQAVADVPVGAFLSGGIDSSTVVALYQKHSPGRVKTFTIGFEEASFDEATYARQVAAHLGTEHHERYVTFREAQAVIPELPSMYDEPFADSSQIPTHLVSRLARERVTVALSGDGGDELFAGYNRYMATERIWSRLKRLPAPLRASVGGAIAMVPPAAWNTAVAMLPAGRRPAFFGTKVQKALRTMRDASDVQDVVDTFLDHWDNRSPVAPHAPLPADGALSTDLGPGAPDVARMMYCDAAAYLPDDILCKVDRAAMAVSLETRVPFLDHRVAELAARIPLSMKIRDGAGKAILRQLLYRHAPRHLFERPKAGFAVPVGEWIKGPLRSWAEDLLSLGQLRSQSYFDAEVVQSRWRSHLAGERDSTEALWSVLMFQAWLGENKSAAQTEIQLPRAAVA